MQYALKPDLALFIDVNPETVLKRLRRKEIRNGEP